MSAALPFNLAQDVRRCYECAVQSSPRVVCRTCTAVTCLAGHCRFDHAQRHQPSTDLPLDLPWDFVNGPRHPSRGNILEPHNW